MKSLYELIHLLLYFYLGMLTHISYTLIFYHQKRILFIKNIIYFILLSILWIHLSNKYNITFNYIYFIIYLIGYYLSYLLLNNNLNKINTYLNKILIKSNYYIKLLITPPIINSLKCYIYKSKIINKYPYLKSNNKNLFYK